MRSEALEKAVQKYLGELKEDPYSRELIFMDDKASDTLPMQKMFTAVDTQSFFADKRAVILKNFDSVVAKEMEEIVPFLLARMESETSVFIEANSIDARSKWGKKLKKEADSQDFPNPKPWEMANWIRGAGRNFDFQISETCAQFLSEFFLPDCEIISSELEKLRFQFPELKQLTEEVVFENLTGSNEGNVFQCLNSFGLRDKQAFLLEYRKLVNANYSSIPFVSQLFNHMSKLLRIQWMLKERKTEKEICSSLKISPYLFKMNQYPRQSSKRPIKTIERILLRIADIDEGTKLGKYTHAIDFELAIIAML